jgi:hypothetical protein
VTLKFQPRNVPLTTPAGNGDALGIVVPQNVRLLEVVVSDVLDSDHLPIIFHILDHVTIRNLSDPVEKVTACDRFKALPLISCLPKFK